MTGNAIGLGCDLKRQQDSTLKEKLTIDVTSVLLEQKIANFKPLEWKDREIFRDYLSKFPQWTSELSFVNLYAWAEIQYPCWALHEDHIVVSYDPGNTGTSSILLQPIGPNPVSLMEKLHSQYGISFVRVDKELLDKISISIRSELVLDDHDYLYTADQIRELRGSKASELRRRVSKFLRNHADNLSIGSLCSDTVGDAQDVIDSWLQERFNSMKSEEEKSGKRDDATACRRIIERWDQFKELIGSIIYYSGRPVSLAIGEVVSHPEIPNGMLISHFEKSVISKELEGLPIYSFQVLCSQLNDRCVVNRMQSAGVEGLRKWKDSWGPFGFREKGRVGF